MCKYSESYDTLHVHARGEQSPLMHEVEPSSSYMSQLDKVGPASGALGRCTPCSLSLFVTCGYITVCLPQLCAAAKDSMFNRCKPLLPTSVVVADEFQPRKAELAGVRTTHLPTRSMFHVHWPFSHLCLVVTLGALVT
jgi:hypothetical protein